MDPGPVVPGLRPYIRREGKRCNNAARAAVGHHDAVALGYGFGAGLLNGAGGAGIVSKL
jgi:hypothetical protein